MIGGEDFARASWDEFTAGLERELGLTLPKYDALTDVERARLRTAASELLQRFREIIREHAQREAHA